MNSEREIQELRREVGELRTLVMANTQATTDLVDAWRTARGLVRFVKLVGSLATGIAAVWALLHLGSK
jgi:hypothetical protein